MPPARLRCDEPHAKRLPAIPKSIDAPVETRSGQIDPNRSFGVCVCIRACSSESEFLFLPNMNRGALSRRRRRRDSFRYCKQREDKREPCNSLAANENGKPQRI